MENKEDKKVFIRSLLSAESKKCFDSLPEEIQFQLLQARDPHGNVQVSKIETEQFLIDLVKKELRKRKKEGTYKGSFSPQGIFCGYEGRSCFPSLFDCRYCYALGYTAALIADAGLTGYM
ncbi:MAG TPA: diphosphate--fructose-6-phosphate 1-phosphotransferase, partial [Parachlamydiaceae bacterium]|nr:diphosphate--fructose-6-phosphate 1-phosphotransferase [Parachlamydiaceae bacterium]